MRPLRAGLRGPVAGEVSLSKDGQVGERPRRTPRNAFRAVGEEGGLVVDSDESKVHVLNPVGSFIYSMLAGTHVLPPSLLR